MNGSHDYKRLVRRWRAVAKAAGLKMRVFAEDSGYPLYFLDGGAKDGGLFLSAGIHGDEPAGTEGMIGWAEANVKRLKKLPCLLFPCLNPWGLVNNSRFDEAKRDLNRWFHDGDLGFVQAWREVLGERRFDLALTLHEDYDAEGVYIYELITRKPFWGEELLKLAAPDLPVETRKTIEGRRARQGVVRRRLKPGEFPMVPEALYLHFHHARRTFTFETPSEFGLERRVAVQVRLIEGAVLRMEKEISA